MPFPPFSKILPGQRHLSARDLNKLQRGVEHSSRIAGAGDVTVSSSSAGIAVGNLSPPSVEIQITGAPVGAAYPWVEVAAGVTPMSGLRGGTATVNPARETSGNTGVAVGTITRAFLSPDQMGYLFDFPSSSGGGVVFSGAQRSLGSTSIPGDFLNYQLLAGSVVYDTSTYTSASGIFTVPTTGYYAGVVIIQWPNISAGTAISTSITTTGNSPPFPNVLAQDIRPNPHQIIDITMPFEGHMASGGTIYPIAAQNSGSAASVTVVLFSVHQLH